MLLSVLASVVGLLTYSPRFLLGNVFDFIVKELSCHVQIPGGFSSVDSWRVLFHCLTVFKLLLKMLAVILLLLHGS